MSADGRGADVWDLSVAEEDEAYKGTLMVFCGCAYSTRAARRHAASLPYNCKSPISNENTDFAVDNQDVVQEIDSLVSGDVEALCKRVGFVDGLGVHQIS